MNSWSNRILSFQKLNILLVNALTKSSIKNVRCKKAHFDFEKLVFHNVGKTSPSMFAKKLYSVLHRNQDLTKSFQFEQLRFCMCSKYFGIYILPLNTCIPTCLWNLGYYMLKEVQLFLTQFSISWGYYNTSLFMILTEVRSTSHATFAKVKMATKWRHQNGK